MADMMTDTTSLKPRASDSFYRNLFAALTFAVFAIAIIFNSPMAYLTTLLFGCLSRAAAKKGWKNPELAGKLPWIKPKA